MVINIKFRYIVQSKAKPKGSKWKSATVFRFRTGESKVTLHRSKVAALSDVKLFKISEFGTRKKYRHFFRVKKIEHKPKKSKSKKRKYKRKK